MLGGRLLGLGGTRTESAVADRLGFTVRSLLPGGGDPERDDVAAHVRDRHLCAPTVDSVVRSQCLPTLLDDGDKEVVERMLLRDDQA